MRTWRRYVAFVLPANLAWEIAQLPLYTIWVERPMLQRLLAAAHCTLGDALIATAALMLALLALGDPAWPRAGFRRVLLLASLLGVAYAVFSEWLNLVVRQSWAYSALMPTVPLLGTGLSPLLQWLVIPPTALWWARRS